MHKTIIFLLTISILALTACSAGTTALTDVASPSQPVIEPDEEATTAVSAQDEREIASTPVSVEYDPDDLDASPSGSDASTITLEGDRITFQGTGATVDGSVITITSAGTYRISGALNDGQVIVDTQDEETVVLVLNGADIACSRGAPIYVKDAAKVVINLAEGTDNRVTDGASYVLEDPESDEPDAAVFSKADLTINGGGSLAVTAAHNNGIASKDDLKITGGLITVDAVNDGVKGRDSVAIKDGTITINAGGDGIQSNNDEDTEKGYVAIEGGTLTITAGLDGVQAETSLLISGGDVTIVTGGGSVESASAGGWGGRGMEGNPNKTADSVKGLKAGVDLTVAAGVIRIDSLDDALHSNDRVTISGGAIQLASGDDGVHADTALTITGGDLTVTRSYEGLDSSLITIQDGTIHVTASDDGVNATSGTDGALMGGRPGWGEASGDSQLTINDGYLVVDSAGDGFDINGPIEMTGGVVIINGPTSNNNGALDYAGAFNITGGFIVAVGSAGMAQTPSASSTQYTVAHTFSYPQAAGTMVHIESESGQEVLTFVPTEEYQSAVVSSPEFENGVTYSVYSGGSSTGTATDGLYSGGSYSPGTEVASYTISSMVTGSGGGRGGFFGDPGGGGGRPARP
jgi:hypothetical protein